MLGQTAPWVGLETSTCNAAPLNTSRVLTSHSALSTYIAGFALAGFILLLSRNDDGISEHKRRAHANASLLLALAAIAGLVCAFLFSSLNAFHCLSVQSSSVYASLLLIIGAMLLVAGISVVAAAEPSIGNTATILRVILFLGGLIMAGRLFFDFQNADRTAESYRHLVAVLATTDGSTTPGLDPGSTTSLDRQLGAYAAAEWPDRPSDEWPSLLASDLFERAPDGVLTASLIATALVACGAALVAWRYMSPDGERGPPSPAAERRWRTWMSASVAFVTIASPVMFGLGLGQGGTLAEPPRWHWILLYAVTLGVILLAVQPPLVAGQRSVINGGRALVRRRRAGAPSTSEGP